MWSIRIVCDPIIQKEAAIISDWARPIQNHANNHANCLSSSLSRLPQSCFEDLPVSLNGLFKDTSSGWRRKRSPYLSRELQMSRKQASSFSSPGHRSAHFYFLCCLFNVCKLGRAWQTIESVNNTHRDFDAYFYRKKVRIIHG